jgi:hypothetical protein
MDTYLQPSKHKWRQIDSHMHAEYRVVNFKNNAS